MFALLGPVCPTVAIGLMLIEKLVLAPSFMSVSLLSAYTVSGIAWLASLTTQPGRTSRRCGVITFTYVVQLLLCPGYSGSDLTEQWRVATGLSPLDRCRISARRGSLR